MKVKLMFIVGMTMCVMAVLSGCTNVSNSKLAKDAEYSELPVSWSIKQKGALLKYTCKDNRIYFITDNQDLTIADAKEKRIVSSFKLDFSVNKEFRMMSVDKDLVALNFTDSIKVVNVKTQKTVLSKQLTDSPLTYTSGSIQVHDNLILYESLPFHDAVALDVGTGNELWRFPSNGVRSVDFAKLDNHCLILMDETVYDVDPKNGAIQHVYTSKKGQPYEKTDRFVEEVVPIPIDSDLAEFLTCNFSTSHLDKSGLAYVVYGPEVFCYGKENELIWHFNIQKGISDQLHYKNLVILEDDDRNLAIVDMIRKKSLYYGTMNRKYISYITQEEGWLYIPQADQSIAVIDLEAMMK